MSSTDPADMSRRQQLVASYKMARQTDKKLGLWLLGALVLGAAVGFFVFWILPGDGFIGLAMSIIGAIVTALLFGTLVFGRRVQAAAYNQMDGTPGAGARALSTLRKGWKTDQLI